MAKGFSPSDQVGSKLKTFMDAAKRANGCCKLLIVSPSPFCGEEATNWRYLCALDRSAQQDPFDDDASKRAKDSN